MITTIKRVGERTRSIRKHIDPANSLAWFAMDGFWLAELPVPAYVAMGATLATGAMLLMWSRRRDEDLALNAWMWMNSLWLLSDLGGHRPLRKAALAVGCLGAVLLATSLRPAKREGDLPWRLRKFRTGR